MTKFQKAGLISVGTVFTLLAVFVSGDYYGLYGLKKYMVLDFIDVSFKPVDQETGAPIIDVRVRCFQKGNNNACTQKENHSTGIVSARIPLQKLVWKSYLFKNKESFVATNDPQLHIMFINYDYTNLVKTFTIDELVKHPVTRHIVKMERKFIEVPNE